LGERKDTPELLQLMDLSVLCSLREGFSNVILESMASGKPVLASNVGGNPESIVDGITGFLFESHDVERLGSKIILLLKDKELRLQLGEAARARAEELFSKTRMVKSYEEMYLFLLHRKASVLSSPAPRGAISKKDLL
jgi:glycosyltransferase involved in cell wall biosynthesis